MKPGLYRILRKAIVVTTRRDSFLPVLGVGSVVEIVERSVSVVGVPDEIFVRFLDYVGEQQTGWLSRTVPLERGGRKLKTELPDAQERFSELDLLREQAFKAGWPVARLCVKFGKNFIDRLQLVTRELGGLKVQGDHTAVTLRALQLILQLPKETTMSQIQESHKAAPKSSSAKKPAAKKAEAPARSMARTIGNALAALKVTGPTVTALQKDQPVKKATLIKLRDDINARAEKAREANQGKRASQLSSVNRLVRRLARKA